MPCPFIDAAHESIAAQLCPSGLKLSLLVHLVYVGGHIYHSKSAPIHHTVLLFKASSVFAHSPRAQNQPAFVSDISAIFQCTLPRCCWNTKPRLRFPGQTDLSGSVTPVPLHTAGLGRSAARAPCGTASLHPLPWHVVARGKPEPQHGFFSSTGCGGDQQQLPSTCSTINAG